MSVFKHKRDRRKRRTYSGRPTRKKCQSLGQWVGRIAQSLKRLTTG